MPLFGSALPETKVVIIGGGYGGIVTAKQLLKHKNVHVTVIDRNSYFQNTVSLYHCVAHPEDLAKNRQELQTALPKATVLVQTIKNVDPEAKKVYFADGTSVDYDYLFIATGRRHEVPTEGAQYAVAVDNGNQIERQAEAVKSAKEITVIGGGACGVEVAGELSETYPNTTIHLISATEHLLPRSPQKASKFLETYLQSRPNVKIYANTKATAILPNQNVTLSSGQTLNSTVAVLCIGGVPNTEFLKSNMSKNLDQTGAIHVTTELKLEGWSNIFAVGDCNDVDEEKLAAVAKKQAVFAVHNLILTIQGKKLKQYQPKKGIVSILVVGAKGVLINYSSGSVSTLSMFRSIKKKLFASAQSSLKAVS